MQGQLFGIEGDVVLTFDKESLKSRLDGMSTRSRTAFALACAERLMPLYHAFSVRNANSRWSYLRSMADNLWDQLRTDTVMPNVEFLKVYASLAPGDDWPTSEFTLLNPLAENAVLALGAAWKCHLEKDSRCACFSAGHAYEAVDYLAQNVGGLDYRDIGGEDTILKTHVVQNELSRQIDDLAMLENASEQDSTYLDIIDLMRKQAIDSGKSLEKVAQALVITQ